MKEANCQLWDKNSYKILQTDLTLQHNETVNDKLDRSKCENLLSKKTLAGLKVINQKFISHPKYAKKIIEGDLSVTQSTVTPLKFHALLAISFNL